MSANDEQCYQEAKAQLAAGNVQAGIEALLRLAESDSDCWAAYRDLGHYALDQGDTVAAQDLLETALIKASQQNACDIATLRLLAPIHHAQANLDRALELYGQILHLDSADPDAIFAIRDILEQHTCLSPIVWARLLKDLRSNSPLAQLNQEYEARIAVLEQKCAELEREQVEATPSSPPAEMTTLDPCILSRLTPVAWQQLCTGTSPRTTSPSAPTHRVSGKLASVGFMVHSADLYNHYHRIWKQLGSGTYTVIVGNVHEDPQSLCRFYQAHGIDAIPVEVARQQGRHFSHLVSNHPFSAGDPNILQELGDYNIRMMYALGKAQWNFADWNKLYDLILCFGPFQAERLAYCENTLKLEVGYPRFDGFFNGEFDKATVLREFACIPDRQTIVWLPTWGELASIRQYGQAISALSDEYNVVVKLHPLIDESDPGAATFLRQLPFTAVIDTPIDNVMCYVAADYLFCDYGGPMFGGIYVDKSILLLDLPGAVNDPLVGTASADAELRAVLPHVSTPDTQIIRRTLHNATLWEEQRRIRAQLRKIFFAPYYGFSSKVVADILQNIEHITKSLHLSEI